jgi:hypothetical protein
VRKLLLISTLFFVVSCKDVKAGDKLYWSAGTGCTITLTGIEAPIAILTCHNAITSGHDSITEGTLEKDGIAVDLLVSHGDTLDSPNDIFYTTPSEGYYSIPPSLELKEEENGTIEIYKSEGVLLG